MPPVVSVIIPVKNGAATLEACLASIRAQDYPYIELIVVDNYSTDNTRAIAEVYADEILVQGPERSTQRNVGFRLSHGEYVLFVDADMILSESVVRECVESGAEAAVIPEVSVGSSFWARVKGVERSLYQGEGSLEAARFFGRMTFSQAGGYDDTLVAGEDWDLHERMSTLSTIHRISSAIYHQEGNATFFRYVYKKFLYGKHLVCYLQKANQMHYQLSGQLGWRRALVYLRGWKTLLQSPILGFATLLLVGAEGIAGIIGVFFSRGVIRPEKQ